MGAKTLAAGRAIPPARVARSVGVTMSPQTVRPARDRYRAALLPPVGIAVALVVVTIAQPTAAAATGMGALAAAAALVAVGVWLRWRTARIEFEPGRIRRTNPVGATTSIATASVASVLILLHLDGPTARPVPGLFLFDTDGGVLLRMRGEVWDVESMADLAAVVPVTPIVIAEPITADEVSRRFPGAVPLWERHPTRYGLAVGALVLSIIAVAALPR
jgi:hypothetical protein